MSGPRAPRSRFELAVFALIRRVPPGRVVTYGQVACLVGAPRGARAVGGALRRCPAGVPWYRVVNGQGRISRRESLEGMMRQRFLLEREGVSLARGRVDLARHRWRGDPIALRRHVRGGGR
jgi:methylated-DNA-protein-cysteine methyltransferase-like protein